MTSQQIERERIALYMRGWNDAAAGRQRMQYVLAYELGYLDATR